MSENVYASGSANDLLEEACLNLLQKTGCCSLEDFYRKYVSSDPIPADERCKVVHAVDFLKACALRRMTLTLAFEMGADVAVDNMINLKRYDDKELSHLMERCIYDSRGSRMEIVLMSRAPDHEKCGHLEFCRSRNFNAAERLVNAGVFRAQHIKAAKDQLTADSLDHMLYDYLLKVSEGLKVLS